jgi:hypothetical protein
MIDFARYDGTGSTVSEYLSLAVKELDQDTIGMWSMVPTGRTSFKLQGEQLDDFLTRFIKIIIEHGACPVRGRTARPGFYEWVEQKQYGKCSDEIAASIIAEWHDLGGLDPEWDWVRFAMPSLIGRPRPIIE